MFNSIKLILTIATPFTTMFLVVYYGDVMGWLFVLCYIVFLAIIYIWTNITFHRRVKNARMLEECHYREAIQQYRIIKRLYVNIFYELPVDPKKEIHNIICRVKALAAIHINANEFAEAIKLYIDINNQEGIKKCYFHWGVAAISKQQYEMAYEKFEKIKYYWGYGVVSELRKDYEKALKLYSFASSLFASHVIDDMIVIVGNNALTISQYDEDLMRAKIIHLKYLLGRMSFSKSERKMKRLIPYYSPPVTLTKGWLLFLYGEICKNKDKQKAREYYYEAISTLKDNHVNDKDLLSMYEYTGMYLLAAELYLERGDMSNAVINLEKYSELDEVGYRGLKILLEVYESNKLKDSDSNSMGVLKRIISLDEEKFSEVDKCWVEKILIGKGDNNILTQYYEKIVSLYPGVGDYEDKLLNAYHKSNEKKYVSYAHNLMKTRKIPVDNYIKLAEIYENNSEFVEARYWYKKAIESFQYDALKVEARKALVRILIIQNKYNEFRDECKKMPYSNEEEYKDLVEIFYEMYKTNKFKAIYSHINDLHVDNIWLKHLINSVTHAKMHEEAIVLYDRLQRVSMLNDQEKWELVKLHIFKEDYGNAEKGYSEIKKKTNAIREQYVSFLIAKNKYEEAYKECKMISDSKHVINHYVKIFSKLNKDNNGFVIPEDIDKKHKMELSKLFVGITFEPENKDIISDIAYTYFRIKNYKKAKHYYTELIRKGEKYKGYRGLFMVSYKEKEYLIAKDHANEMLKLKNNKEGKSLLNSAKDQLILQRINVLKTMIGKLEGRIVKDEESIVSCAMTFFEEYKGLSSPELQMELNKMYFSHNDYLEEAISGYQKCANDSESGIEARKMVGLCFMRDKKYSAAYDNFEILINRIGLDGNKEKDYFYSLAESFEENKAFNQAKMIYSKIMARDIIYKDVKKKVREMEDMLINNEEIREYNGNHKMNEELVNTRFESRAKEVESHEKTIMHNDSLSDNSIIEGKYEMIRLLGEGGMGQIYEARNMKLNRTVAIKKMRDEIRIIPKQRKNFLREARITAKLAHKNIVSILDVIENEDGDIYIIYEFINGVSIDKLLDSTEKFSLMKCKEILIPSCQALKFAHENRVIHRDFKPSNIMIDNRKDVKVMDFGIASEAKSTISRISGTQIAGTPVYMAPEQELGECDERADIYSLGVTFYEMLTGEIPFKGGNYLAQKERGKYIEPKDLVENLSNEVNAVIVKCLAPNVKDRYQNVGEVLKAIETL